MESIIQRKREREGRAFKLVRQALYALEREARIPYTHYVPRTPARRALTLDKMHAEVSRWWRLFIGKSLGGLMSG